MGGTYLEGFEPHRGPDITHAHEGDLDVMTIHGSSDWAGGGLVSDGRRTGGVRPALRGGSLVVAPPLLDEVMDWQFRTLDPELHSPGYLGYGMGVEARESNGFVFRGHRGHWGVLMHVDPVTGVTITGTINQSSRRPDALMHGAAAALRQHLPAQAFAPVDLAAPREVRS